MQPKTLTLRLVGHHPFGHARHRMAIGAHALVERYRLAGAQHPLQFRLVGGHQLIGLHLEQDDRPEVRLGAQQRRILVARDHIEKLLGQPRTRVQLDVAGEHKVRHGGIAGRIPADVHRIEELVLVLVHGRRIDVQMGRRQRAVERRAQQIVGRRNGGGQMLVGEVQVEGGVLADELRVRTAVAHVPDGVEGGLHVGAGREERNADGCFPSGDRGDATVRF